MQQAAAVRNIRNTISPSSADQCVSYNLTPRARRPMILAQLQRSPVTPKSATDPNTSDARKIPRNVRVQTSNSRLRRVHPVRLGAFSMFCGSGIGVSGDKFRGNLAGQRTALPTRTRFRRSPARLQLASGPPELCDPKALVPEPKRVRY